MEMGANNMTVGRPTDYSQEVVDQAWDYIESYKVKHGHTVPSLVGLCKVLKRGKTTLYTWADDDTKEFRDIVDAINEAQELALMNGGLNSDFNSTITKLLLTKHGYSDKQAVELDIPEGVVFNANFGNGN
jgi:hypothetical protein